MSNVVVEIRSGSGGDEAKDFVRILTRMYLKYATRADVGWFVSALDEGDSMTTFMLEGNRLDRLNGETGVHCIQRIPPNRRTSGKVHTSTATVAVMSVPPTLDGGSPSEAEMRQFFRVETMRGSGAGGQNRNKVESAVRVTHLRTGISAICRDERSQAANRERAWLVCVARVQAFDAQRTNGNENEQRRGQVGNGMRAERFRTYDMPEDRLVDRRSGKKLQNLKRILDGDLDAVLQ